MVIPTKLVEHGVYVSGELEFELAKIPTTILRR